LGNSGQLFLKQTIELIEATPSSAFDQANKNPSHRFEVDSFIAVKDKHLATERLAKSFDGFSFACTCWTIRITTISKLHSKYKS
jgi:hypothetical protein